MEYPEKDINWDKLLPKLEDQQHNANSGFAEDSEEALQLRMAQEMRRRLQESGPDEKFPVEAGWQRFRQAQQKELSGKGTIRKLYWAAAAAAAIIVAVVGVQFLRKEHPSQKDVPALADAKPVGGVAIKSSNGKTVLLTDSTQQLQLQNGATVNANDQEIVYAPADAGATTTDTLMVARGNRVRITLADGTGVWVNAATRLIYPSAFSRSIREVALEGEAYFEVARDARRPFVVRAGGMDVEVLGTQFNVNTYTGNIYTTLAEGKVKTTAAGKSMVLQPGEQAAFDRAAGSVARRSVELRTVTAWKDGQIYFDDANLIDITNTLSRDYDYTFRFEDETLRQLSFTLDMPRPATLQAVLEQITKTTGDVRFRLENKTVYLFRQ